MSPRADAGELRRAYLDRAREAHPDRHIDASGAQRGEAERRIREVNEAWHVLGNPRRRRRYDLERTPETRFVTRTDGTMPPDVVFEEIDGTARLIRGLPWMIVVVVLFAIFVFTAYAASGGDTAVRTCIRTSGAVVTDAACGSPGARRVITTVLTTQACAAGSERFQPSTGSTVYCLEV
ncbi:MAG: curved DNA-binding protein [Acidimicrobiaceae bacterium]